MGGLRRGQGVDDVDGGGEQHGVAGQTALAGQRGGQVGFAQAGSAHENDVGLVFEEGEAKEILHLGAMDLFGPGPVELFE